MATQNPLMPPGQYVQYDATTQDPRAQKPAPEEQGLGIIRQSFTRSDGPYYQVIWNAGDLKPKSGLYHGTQLKALSQQQAQELLQNQQAGQGADVGIPGSNYQQPTLPTIAVPPELQGSGTFKAGPPDEQNPSLTEVS